MNQIKFYCSFSSVAMIIFLSFLTACNKPVLSEAGANDQDVLINLKKKKVLLIALDGVVGASMEEMKLPAITKMSENAVYTFYGLIDTISNNGTTWADLLTGTRLNKHQVKSENFSGADFTRYPSFLKRVKDSKTNLRTVAITTLPLLATGVFGNEVERNVHLPDNDAAARDSAVNRLKTDDMDILLVNFSTALRAGKSFGFSTGAARYRTALQQLDGYIDDLVYAAEHRDNYENEDWMIIVTSTHGGKTDGSYGGNSAAERNVFSIYYNPQQKKTLIPRPLVNLPYEGNFIYFSNPGNRNAYTNDAAYRLGAQNFTVELRVKGIGGGSDPVFIGNKSWASGANPGWLIFRSGTNWAINLANQSRVRRDVNGLGVINDNKWHMLSATFNRQGLLTTYYDGVLAKTLDIAPLAGSSIDGPLPFVVGDDGTRAYNPTGGNAINSYITNVRVWNTVLPADVIQAWQYLDITSSHPFYGNLVGYWKLDEASGTIIKDYSKTGANLALTGIETRPAVRDILNPSTLDTRVLTPGLVDHSFRIMTWLGVRVDYQAWELDGKVWSGN